MSFEINLATITTGSFWPEKSLSFFGLVFSKMLKNPNVARGVPDPKIKIPPLPSLDEERVIFCSKNIKSKEKMKRAYLVFTRRSKMC